MLLDLKDDTQLKAACKSALEQTRTQPGNQEWRNRLMVLLEKVRESDHDEFTSEAFQRMLWDSRAISATGMGSVDISLVAADGQIAEVLWQLKSTYRVLLPDAVEMLIDSTWSQVLALVELKVKRRPLLKLCRLLAAICPEYFTTITNFRKLHELAIAMGFDGPLGHGLSEQRWVMARLKGVLDDPGPGLTQFFVEHMTVPWLLYVNHVQKAELEATEVSDLATGEERLNPLPADRRRRGMLAIGGGSSTIRSMIEFAREGCTREDFREHMHSINPGHVTGTLNTQINALIAEWGVLRPDGDNLYLTPRGESFLESGDPDDFCDWLLTRILGFDNMLYLLMQEPLTVKALALELQKVNPGWTSNFVPSSLINWLRSLKLVELASDKTLQLTERGLTWAERIHWVPGLLGGDPVLVPQETSPDYQGYINRPKLGEILESFDDNIVLRPELIGQLDAGLWSHHRRHLAVLTGLSGAGKTLLARGYALGLRHGEKDPAQGLLTVAVQPGWHDPSCLLGYINPINNEVYVRTALLDFLLCASADPDRAYTVVLDEMNLSHPEQYLAPLLSAMETGDRIELHAQGVEINGIPASLDYPANLFIIGTVNMDETTHGLSDKVLDRACVIEFWDIDVDAFPGWKNSPLSSEQTHKVQQALKDLVAALRPVRLHFGWRTISDVMGYIREALRWNVIDFESALDQAIYSKVLPKLRGEDSPRIQRAFAAVQVVLKQNELTQSQAKMHELLEDLQYLGSARFWR
ncbi:hypothetical protein HX807_06000 [Pseudomonas sp. D8002]|jgi:5-methylcytosine-specific restriction protein B|uniref:McrB family protein n=1 Tax=unclassified Pseudomonas TaxID=196821 RepID=UPI0015A04FDA|nr:MULTISPECIES: hypothetical protein [unclassified Pseudomonas]MDP9062434.1 hypothetical protein [Pseudomonadota bacterium]MDE1912703.1 hypothetical protein [Pseudomonas sp.]MDE2032951.1 hypothetical protein [Pseudomonas sp.]MDE2189274.1 hypothetical protein [Pseudomonas sp.]MDE2558202.1 hypothetical protein [Pseudomonas sp.]